MWVVTPVAVSVENKVDLRELSSVASSVGEKVTALEELMVGALVGALDVMMVGALVS